MIRFALTVTAIELVLTLGASLWVSLAEIQSSFFSEDDLRSLQIPYETSETKRWTQFTTVGYDTRAALKNPRQSLYVSVRSDMTPEDFEFRHTREVLNQGRSEKGEISLINEPIPGERGYAVRHRSENAVRFELARLRGREILIVRVVREKPFDSLPSVEMTRCERRARTIQEHLMSKMRWRE